MTFVVEKGDIGISFLAVRRVRLADGRRASRERFTILISEAMRDLECVSMRHRHRANPGLT
jgi:hypothetical protein